jgi:hypothetical protein
MSDIPTNDLPTRVAVLEEISRGTKAALERIERRIESLSNEHHADFRSMRSDFRWLLGVMIGWGVALLGVMAHGFHWI